MKQACIIGTLVGVRDGPAIVIEVKGQVKKFPLDYPLSVNWVRSHMGKQVICLIDNGRVVSVD